MKLKSKKGLIISILAAIILIAILLNEGYSIRATSKFSYNEPLTAPVTGNDFYYSRMNDYEKEIYAEIVKRIEEFKPDLISLYEPISAGSYLLIWNALLNSGRDYFYVNYSTPLGEDKQTVGVDIHYIPISFSGTMFYDYMESIPSPNGDPVFQYIDGSLESLPVTSEATVLEYRQQQQQTNEKIGEIIAGIPPGSNKVEAFYYLADWVNQNIPYDEELYNKVISYEPDDQAISNDLLSKTGIWASSILEGKGACGGLSAILVNMLNQVGIEAYIEVGKVRANQLGHAWVAIKIGDEVLWTDPSGDPANPMQRQSVELRNRKQMERAYIFNF